MHQVGTSDLHARHVGGSKSERKRLQSQPASLGLASALNYGRCIIQDTAHTFSSSSRAKVSLNKGVIYEGPDGRNPVYGAFFFFGECMRARLLSGERDLNSKLTVQMPLYLSLHRFEQTHSQPAAFVTSSVNSEQERVRSFPDRPPAVSFLPFLAPANCLLALSLSLSLVLPLPQHCK
jgi:hypothetical protein